MDEKLNDYLPTESEEEFDFDGEELVVMRGDVPVTAHRKGTLSDWSRNVKAINRKERRLEAKRQIRGMR